MAAATEIVVVYICYFQPQAVNQCAYPVVPNTFWGNTFLGANAGIGVENQFHGVDKLGPCKFQCKVLGQRICRIGNPCIWPIAAACQSVDNIFRSVNVLRRCNFKYHIAVA